MNIKIGIEVKKNKHTHMWGGGGCSHACMRASVVTIRFIKLGKVETQGGQLPRISLLYYIQFYEQFYITCCQRMQKFKQL